MKNSNAVTVLFRRMDNTMNYTNREIFAAKRKIQERHIFSFGRSYYWGMRSLKITLLYYISLYIC